MDLVLPKERENRSAEVRDLIFHAYTITPQTAHTAVLLLEAVEPEILCMTLRALTKFIEQDEANRQLVFDLNGIKYIVPNITHSEINIRRFALKALAQLCQLPKGPEMVLQNPVTVKYIVDMIIKVHDIYILEFASLVLSEVTKELLGCDQVIATNILSHLIERMKESVDPDVQKNCLQIFSNLLSDPVTAQKVTKSPHFSWKPLLALMQSKFIRIQQLAIYTVNQLICRVKDNLLQKSFRDSNGINVFMEILESYEFRDCHMQLLQVIKNYLETEENAQHFYSAGCIVRLMTYLEYTLTYLKQYVLAVLAQLSNTNNGRKAIFETNTDVVFCNNLDTSNIDLLAEAIHGISNMTLIFDSAVRMSGTNAVGNLCAILSDDNTPWFDVKMNALRAVASFCKMIPNAAATVVEPRNFNGLRAINKKTKNVPIEAQRLAIQCFINLLDYNKCVDAMLNEAFIQELFEVLVRTDITLSIMVCEVLSGLMSSNHTACQIVTKKKGEYLFSNLLVQTNHIGLRTAICRVIQSGVTAQGARLYFELGLIEYMINNKHLKFTCPVWDSTLNAIYSYHAAVKFAYTGQLSINDFTRDKFYVSKRITPCFPNIDKISEELSTPRYPVYVFNFYPSPKFIEDFKDDLMSYGTSEKSIPDIASKTSITSDSSKLPNMLPDDPHLRSYLDCMKLWMFEETTENRLHPPGSIELVLIDKVKMLAEFVATQMSGLRPDDDCSIRNVDVHINELKSELEDCLIPIGLVRVGGTLERSILFKALADVIHLPCALKRATSAHAWCEVAIPEVELENSPRQKELYPSKLLRANYVVDLMNKVGALYKVGSLEANEYCFTDFCIPYFATKMC